MVGVGEDGRGIAMQRVDNAEAVPARLPFDTESAFRSQRRGTTRGRRLRSSSGHWFPIYISIHSRPVRCPYCTDICCFLIVLSLRFRGHLPGQSLCRSEGRVREIDEHGEHDHCGAYIDPGQVI